ncbi:MAG: hypothetical protein RBQ97_11705 [Acholeplasma sp.]|nr:hypothetical protein [Acholeplasma sp.]
MNKIKNSCFEEFIKNISITSDEDERLKSSHSNIRTKISKSDLNVHMVKTILGGSYKKNTMVRTIESDTKKVDVDILVIFNYNRSDVKPHKLISKVRDTIEEMPEYRGKTTIQKRSIGVELSKTHIDIIPVLEVNNNSDQPLLISTPDKQNWDETNPIKSIEYFNAQALNKKNLRMIVKTFKWWKKINKPESQRYPISYGIEILCSNYYKQDENLFESMLKTLESINDYTQMNEIKPHLEDPCKNGNDLFRKMSQNDYESFRNKFNKHVKTLRKAIIENKTDEVRMIFGDKFPKCTIIDDSTQEKLMESTTHLRTYAKE